MANDRNLHVNLAFSADTSKAKQQIKDLQDSLTKLSNSSDLNFDDSIKTVIELKNHLKEATNVNTGNLDFSKLNDSLKKGEKTLEDYADTLRSMGPEGEKAFLSLADAIASSEVPIKRVNVRLQEMWATMKNTARWQLSSSVLHGFMGAIQSAYGYAQDLNESLNNIRIVTGYSVDQMSKFADQANKAAKALSTTTTEYTNASLIYYQQGLSDAEVQKRTDVTIKMANVAGQSAEVVSDQMTAIWNNFYDGTKSIEYYADVMTALGAATASSTDEIAGGLEKFAAIADTIGLSYEYAASALATITSNTRQSEEVVGTALKTIFARIQGLNLGETLDDGTTLNKYSEALDKVGISIFDQAGELKNMDDILDEMAAKWDNLSKAQQTALAQTVGGARQYTQLIALMDNWDKGDNDSMVTNLNTARNSSGSLQDQADIYAESWEAASDRVRAASENVFDTIINDEAFIDILNLIEKIITQVDNTIEAFGGLGGVLATLGAIGTKVFKNQISQSLTDTAYNVRMAFGGKEKIQNERREAVRDLAAKLHPNNDSNPDKSETNKARSEAMENYLLLQDKMIEKNDQMTESEKKVAQAALDRYKQQIDGLSDVYQGLDNALQDREENEIDIGLVFSKAKILMRDDEKIPQEDKKKWYQEIEANQKKFTNNKKAFVDYAESINKVEQFYKSMDKATKETDEGKRKLQEFLKVYQGQISDTEFEEISKVLEKGTLSAEEFDNVLIELGIDLERKQDEFVKGMKESLDPYASKEEINAKVDAQIDGEYRVIEAKNKTAEANKKVKDSQENVDEIIEKSKGKQAGWADVMVASADAVMTTISVITTWKGVIDTLNNPDLSGWEKFLAIVTAVGTTLPSVISTVSNTTEVFANFAEATKKTKAAGAAVEVVGKSSSVASGSVKGLGVAFQFLTGPVGLAIIALTAVVGIMAAISHARLEDERAAKAAAKAAEDLSNAYNEIKSQADSLKSSFDSFNSITEKLKECTKGTEEWNSTLEQANEQAMQLLQTYPQLMQFYTGRDSNNVITFDEDAVNDYLYQLQDKEQLLQSASIMAQAKTNEANVYSDFSNLSNKMGFAEANKDLYENIEHFADVITDEELIDKLKELGIATAENVHMFVGYREEIVEVAKKAKEASKIISNSSALVASNVYGENSSNVKNAMGGELYNKQYGQAQNDILKSFNSLWAGSGKWAPITLNGKNITVDEIWDQFQAETGAGELASNPLQKKDGVLQFAYLNEDGKIDYVTKEYVAATLAASEALKVLTDSSTKLDTILRNIDKTYGKDVGEEVKNYIANGDFSSASLSELNSLSGITEEDLRKMFIGYTDEEIAKVFKTDTIENAVIQWNEDVEKANNYIVHAGDNLSRTVQSVYKRLDTSNLSGEDIDKLKSSLVKIFKDTGEEGLLLFEAIYNSAGEKGSKFIEEISSIDWVNASPEELTNKLEELGISTVDAIPSIERLVELMRDVANISIDDAKAWFEEWNKFSGLKYGDEITEEEMAEMVKRDSGLKDFFTKTINGYALTGNADEFNARVDSIKYEGHQRYIDQTERQMINLSNLSYDNLTNERLGGQVNQQRIDYLASFGYENTDQLNKWQEAYDNEQFNEEEIQGIIAAIHALGDKTGELSPKMEELSEKSNEIKDSMSFEQFKDDAEKLDLDYALLLEDAEKLKKEYNLSAEAARNLATANARLDRGILDLRDNFENYQQVLSNPDDARYLDYVEKVRSSFADIFDADESNISNEFIENIVGNPEDFQAIINGNLDIIKEYKRELAAQTTTSGLNKLLIEIETKIKDPEKLEDFKSKIAELDNISRQIQISGEVNPALENDFLTMLEEMVNAAEMTQSQVSGLLASMGVNAEVKTEYQKQTTQVPTSQKRSYITLGKKTNVGDMELADFTRHEELTTNLTNIDTFIPVSSIEVTSKDGKSSGGSIFSSVSKTSTNAPSPTVGASSQFGSNTNNSMAGGLGNNGSSGGKATKIKETKKHEVVERYKELNDLLDDVADQLNDIEKLTERSYGKTRLKGLAQQNELIQQEISLLKQKRAEAKNYLMEDRKALQSLGYNFTFDKNGNISNYTEQMTKAYNKLSALEKEYNATYQGKSASWAQKFINEKINPVKEEIGELQDAIKQYDETKELIEDIENQIDDKFYQWQDNNYEILHYTLEIEIEIKDLKLKEIDYYLNKIKEDFYELAEAVTYMNQQGDEWISQLGDYKTFVEGIQASYFGGGISQATYVEGLKEAQDSIYDLLNQLNEQDKEMLAYYEKVLSAASDKIGKHIEHLEHLTSTLDHYKNIVTLINGEFDYENIDKILNAQTKTIGNELNALKNNYNILLKQKEELINSYNAAETENERKVYEQMIQDLMGYIDEAESKIMEKTEQFGELLQEKMKNLSEQAFKEFQNALTDGLGFEAISNSLSRLSSYQEEYLTKTNQIYETQKMMRTAQKASDATDNQASKVKLKNFMSETKSLQEKNQLSKLELEIQQAKYDMLLAQIALEDAQNAKNTVRLTRDSEGNFGYVYTADAANIAEKEQELADAENKLYNISLENANKYGQKILELKQQMADEMYAAYEKLTSGQMTQEEYEREVENIKSSYLALNQSYVDSYNIALDASESAQVDAWIRAYEPLMQSNEELSLNTQTLFDTLSNILNNYQNEIKNSDISNVLNNLDELTQNIVDSSGQYGEVVDNIITKTELEIDAVRNSVTEYAKKRDEIMKTIATYEELIVKISDLIKTEALREDINLVTPSYEENDYSGGGGGGGGGSPSQEDTEGDPPKKVVNTKDLDYARQNLAYAKYQLNELNKKVHATAPGQYDEDDPQERNSNALDKAINERDYYQKNVYDYWAGRVTQLEKKYADSYDTGGYTGAWGPEGRLAMLHQKELVLNADDTKNFLAATDILRNISQFIDLQAASNVFSSRITSTTLTNSTGALEQIVTIEANFPNVQDRNEIQEAFNNLINTASQYANRKI